MSTSWKDREIGSLWRKGDKKNGHYTGFVEINGKKHRIVIFKNNYKEEGSQEADLRIYTEQEKSK